MTKSTLILISIGMLAFSCQQQPTPPNIVLIMSDDMGYECLGINGNTEYETPHIDKIAREGMRFDNCYSQPLCTPSRVKIMTGKYNYRNYDDFGHLNPKEISFANLLKEKGYETCIAGKWQLNGINRNNPNNQDLNRPHHFGFDEYCLWQLHHTRTAQSERFANPLITQNGKDLPRNPEAYGPQIFADFILDFIDRKADKPFFVYYPMVLVHDPFVPTPDSPEWADPQRRYEQDTTYYADMMAYTDKIVGSIANKLKEKGLWENTLFIFTGDNGTHESIYSSTLNGVVQGAKGQTINHGNHVPLVLSFPKEKGDKSNAQSLVSFADFLPTLCETAGIAPYKYTTDGKSFLPIIKGECEGVQEEILIHYTPRWGQRDSLHNRWAMDAAFKLYQDGRFYNTQDDPFEKRVLENLTEKEMKIKKRLQSVLEKNEKIFPFEQNNKTSPTTEV